MSCHRSDGAYDGQIAWIGHQVPHERAVDLDGIEPLALQIREAGVASPEIIDRNIHPQLSQAFDRILFQLPVSPLTSLEDCALGKFDLQNLGTEAISARLFGNEFRQVRPQQLYSRHIHGDRNNLVTA
jgi:hypothetical protein